MSENGKLLDTAGDGQGEISENLLPLVYDELRKLAAARLAQEKPGQTLQATALVHEAYLRIMGPSESPAKWHGRAHFFAAAGEAMRRILVEKARRKKRVRHGGELNRVDLGEELWVGEEPAEKLLDLDVALEKLAQTDPEACQLVHLRYFAGLTLAQSAELMGISKRSGDRLWAFAKAWLLCEIQEKK